MATPVRIFLIDALLVVRQALRALISVVPEMEVVGEAAGSDTLLEQIYSLHPDLIIVDPVTAGRETAAIIGYLRRVDPAIRVLVLTNSLDTEHVLTDIGAGVQGYLLKGTAGPAILQAIRDLQQGKIVLDPALDTG